MIVIHMDDLSYVIIRLYLDELVIHPAICPQLHPSAAEATDVKGTMDVVHIGWMISDWRLSWLHQRRKGVMLNRSKRRTENDG